tara:strand:- start:167 stop:553 length:387 start_codon:yes stop_codon:yes gene_type:complete
MSYQYKAGLGDAGSYQVAGKPFISGSTAGGTQKFEFPTVTQWVQVRNNDTGAPCVVALSELALGGPANAIVLAPANVTTNVATSSPIYDWKITEIWVSTSNDITIVAGLTGVSTLEITNNWSGSAGVG